MIVFLICERARARYVPTCLLMRLAALLITHSTRINTIMSTSARKCCTLTSSGVIFVRVNRVSLSQSRDTMAALVYAARARVYACVCESLRCVNYTPYRTTVHDASVSQGKVSRIRDEERANVRTMKIRERVRRPLIPPHSATPRSPCPLLRYHDTGE